MYISHLASLLGRRSVVVARRLSTGRRCRRRSTLRSAALTRRRALPVWTWTWSSRLIWWSWVRLAPLRRIRRAHTRRWPRRLVVRRIIILVVLVSLTPYPRRETTDRDCAGHYYGHPVPKEGVVGRVTARGRWGVEWAAAAPATAGGGGLVAVVVGHFWARFLTFGW